MSYDRVPLEMREYRHWIVWRFEQREGKKPTKVPYSPLSGTRAASDDPHTWASFDAAVAAQSHGFDGIGFVLTKDDPYCLIDLDDCAGDEECLHSQNAIFANTKSYAELSPSGKGLHIICRASIDKNRRRGKTELYSSGQYTTMTGTVYRDTPIQDDQTFVSALWHGMRADAIAPTNASDAPASEEDTAVVARMFAASYGAKARDLYEGRWQQHFPNSDGASEADLSLTNYIALNTNNREQTRRLFYGSALGPRDKYVQRPNLVDDMIAKAFAIKSDPDAHAGIIAQVKDAVDRAKTVLREGVVAPSNDPLPIIYARDLATKALVPPDWLVPDMIAGHNVTLLCGDGGAGKSLLALILAYSVASADRRWLGTIVRHGPSLFLSAEDDEDETHRRLTAIARAEGTPLDQLAHPLAIAALADRDALVAALDPNTRALATTALYDALAAHIEAHRPAAAILDTLADLFGGNENDRGQARWFIGILRRLAITFNTAIVMLAHPSREGMKSGRDDGGSTAWHNSVRNRLSLSRVDGEPNGRILETKKSNYGPIGGQIRLEFRSGTFIVVGRADNAVAHRVAQEQSVDDTFLALVAEFNGRNHRISPSAHSGSSYAPKLFARHPNSGGFKVEQFKAAMERLLASGAIEVGRSGDYASKLKDNIVIVAPSGLASGFTSK